MEAAHEGKETVPLTTRQRAEENKPPLQGYPSTIVAPWAIMTAMLQRCKKSAKEHTRPKTWKKGPYARAHPRANGAEDKVVDETMG